MSKKYIPSFLRDGSSAKDYSAFKDGGAKDSGPPTRNFTQERNIASAFTKVPHDYIKETPVSKLATGITTGITTGHATPATLASITSLSGTTTKGSGSFASKFAQQVRNSEDPNYQKPVDLSSIDDFPALGAVRQKNNVTMPPFKPQLAEKLAEKLTEPLTEKLTELTPITMTTTAPSFAEMASMWAKKKENDDIETAEFTRRKELEEEKMRQAARLMKKQPILGSIGSINRHIVGREDERGDEEEDENIYVNPDEHSSLGGDSNYEFNENEEESSDDSYDDDVADDEYNPNVGSDGRHKDDLY